jgi:hypothetical protein
VKAPAEAWENLIMRRDRRTFLFQSARLGTREQSDVYLRETGQAIAASLGIPDRRCLRRGWDGAVFDVAGASVLRARAVAHGEDPERQDTTRCRPTPIAYIRCRSSLHRTQGGADANGSSQPDEGVIPCSPSDGLVQGVNVNHCVPDQERYAKSRV